MNLSSGLRLRSQVCDTEVIVVKPARVDLTCGGHPLVELTSPQREGLSAHPSLLDGNQLGKRYTDSGGELEVLVTKAGAGRLADGTEPLVLKEAKALPSSD